MGDELKSETRTPFSAPGFPASSVSPAGDAAASSGHRIDLPHGPPTTLAPLPPPVAAAPTDVPVVGSVSASSPATAGSPVAIRDNLHREQLLVQAGQIAEHLREQLGDVNRREQSLSEQLTLLDRERRNVRLWVQEFEEEMQQRGSQLQTSETDLTRKIQSCEKLIGELEEQERALDSARDALAVNRAELRKSVDCELDVDREALADARNQIEAERAKIADEAQQQRHEHTDALLGMEQRLEEDRARIRLELAAELAEEQLAFRAERDQWQAERAVQTESLAQERQHLQSAVDETRVEMDRLQSQQTAELQQQLDEFTARLRTAERESVELRAEQKRVLDAECEETEQRLHSQRERLEQERRVFDNRISFQQQHLEKLRGEVDTLQREQRIENQQAHARLEQGETVLRLRFDQATHYRELLEMREESVGRERQMLAASRQSFDSEAALEYGRFQSDRESWDHERQTQRAEIRRQQDMLALHAENLEARKLRLDQLRTELEETHRETLEARMAVDEAWAQLTQAAGAESASERVEASRTALSDSYRHLREALASQRQEVLDTKTSLQQETEEFRKERDGLTESIAKREEAMRLHEQQLRREVAELDQRNASHAGVQETHITERAETEQVIRHLLSQLTAFTGETISDPQMPTSLAASTPHADPPVVESG